MLQMTTGLPGACLSFGFYCCFILRAILTVDSRSYRAFAREVIMHEIGSEVKSERTKYSVADHFVTVDLAGEVRVCDLRFCLSLILSLAFYSPSFPPSPCPLLSLSFAPS